jgi:hypothetical protein
MPVTRLLSHWFGQHTVIGHRAREAALFKLVEALLGGGKLVLTQLGRHRAGEAYTKHHIKAADRLLGNRHLHAERDGLYRAIARTLLAGIQRPLLLVDWSDADLRIPPHSISRSGSIRSLVPTDPIKTGAERRVWDGVRRWVGGRVGV